jgi:hypothetical protein
LRRGGDHEQQQPPLDQLSCIWELHRSAVQQRRHRPPATPHNPRLSTSPSPSSTTVGFQQLAHPIQIYPRHPHHLSRIHLYKAKTPLVEGTSVPPVLSIACLIANASALKEASALVAFDQIEHTQKHNQRTRAKEKVEGCYHVSFLSTQPAHNTPASTYIW